MRAKTRPKISKRLELAHRFPRCERALGFPPYERMCGEVKRGEVKRGEVR